MKLLLFVFLTVTSLLFPTSAILKDIVIVLDTSHSLEQNEIVEAIDFIYNVTQWLTVGTSDILISVVTFSTDVTEQFPLSSYSDRTTLLSAIQSLSSLTPSGATYTFDALTYVKTTSFLAINGGRSSAAKAVLVMTDGQSTNYPSTKQEADQIRSDLSAEVFAIGIGDAGTPTNNIEIPAIASDPDSYYTYYVESFEFLCSIIPSIVPKLDPAAVAPGIASCPSEDTTTAVVDKGSNLGLLAGILSAVGLLALLATIVTALLIRRSRAPKIETIEDKTIEAVNQYTNPPKGHGQSGYNRPRSFDLSQLDHIPNIGPRGFAIDS